MAKIELKGKFTIVNPAQKLDVGENGFDVQETLFFVTGYTDGHGDKVGKDEEWPLSVFGDKIKTLDLIGNEAVGKKATITVFINPKTWYKKEDTAKKSPFHSINGVVSEVKFV